MILGGCAGDAGVVRATDLGSAAPVRGYVLRVRAAGVPVTALLE
jgi:hypothetical protein